MVIRRSLLLILLTSVLFSGRLATAAPHFQVIQKTPLPGDGSWDYLSVDPDQRRLFIAHETQVDVVDIDRVKLSTSIPNTFGVHGVAISDDRGFTSNGREGTVTAFDRRTLQFLGKTQVGEGPDAILYDPASRRVFTFCGKSHEAWALDAASGQAVGRIPLGGKPEFAVADGSGTVFDNLQDTSQIVVLDSKNLKIKQKWAIAGCEGPSSLAMDPFQRRLFIGCGNQKMAVMDADSGKVLTTLPIGEHVDATVFDPGTGNIFNSNGDGTLTIIHEDSPNAYHVVDTVATQRGARTVALDPKTHQLFLVSAQFGPAPASTSDNPHPRPTVLPGTFVILVVDNK